MESRRLPSTPSTPSAPSNQTGHEESRGTSDKPRRVIKRYSNRKLYDTRESRYVTLVQIAQMIRGGEEVQVIDNNSKDDLTEVTLAQIIYEEQKSHGRSVPLSALKEIIHQRTEKVLHDLREGPIGRLIPGARTSSHPPAEGAVPTTGADSAPAVDGKVGAPRGSIVGQAKETLEEWQQKIDERVRAVLASFRPLQQLQNEMRHLESRVDALESKLPVAKSKTRAGDGG